MKNILVTLLIITKSFGLSFAQEGNPSSNETVPVFAKGKMQLSQFFSIYLKYPEEAIDLGKSGTVKVALTVEEDGEPTNPRVIESIYHLLDAEALRVVSLFPYFTPATIAGESVKTDIVIPVKFVIGETEEADEAVSVASKEKFPLYVIDGKIVNDNINVNAEEIESIRVIKGKKAIAKYGERAEDGAIIITTKRITNPR